MQFDPEKKYQQRARGVHEGREGCKQEAPEKSHPVSTKQYMFLATLSGLYNVIIKLKVLKANKESWDESI